jgi:hypothetical protein
MVQEGLDHCFHWARFLLPISQYYTDLDSLFATTFTTSFLKYATKVYDAYATSAFQKHSALATANVVGTIIGLVTYPIMAKFSNASNHFLENTGMD